MSSATTIDEVITALDLIIDRSIKTNNPMGYFAALYKKVTVKVKEGIANNYFEDGPRMEKLDVIFATRYIDAYWAYQTKESLTSSWQKTFDMDKNYWPIVLQHLLGGMNAHINLDLGIAAANVMEGQAIEDLKGDFDKINEVLAGLVGEVQDDLAAIWPTLHKILKWSGKIDDFMVNFSMQLARDGAWKFAKTMHATPQHELQALLQTRDLKIANNLSFVFPRNYLIRFVFSIARLGEKGSVVDKIERLNGSTPRD